MTTVERDLLFVGVGSWAILWRHRLCLVFVVLVFPGSWLRVAFKRVLARLEESESR
jgi:hypothetical protein